MIFSLTWLVGLTSLLVTPVAAQFGVNKKRNIEIFNEDPGGELGTDLPNMQEMFSDRDMAEAIQMFANMSPKEREKTTSELTDMLGDDPETRKLVEEVMEEVGNMNPEQLTEEFGELLAEEQLAFAMSETLEQLANADEEMLGSILQKKDAILDSVIESGQITEEDAERYKNDPAEWERELKFIWDELQKQAA
eukprot:CAMPEP_0195529522 /NCGR_PEP_ID=MMETSP0794_2-20130614/32117_1 /TAXON_ID=515487 /ORGANISM="Stephanopyxis turris, Strain CCMP 815" /LENGTH=192 /DNA_ID=CAMNT_0040660843 /DNA_START=29 /DNA_END=607 /DNA_ORIENTATION=+